MTDASPIIDHCTIYGNTGVTGLHDDVRYFLCQELYRMGEWIHLRSNLFYSPTPNYATYSNVRAATLVLATI